MPVATFQIEGLPELQRKLSALGKLDQSKALRSGFRKAANLVRDAAKAGALRIDNPATANKIAANIVTQYDGRYFRKTGDLKMKVGIRGGAKSYKDTKENRRKGRVGKTYAAGGTVATKGALPGGDTFYWRFHEFGTEKMKATPFMRPALRNNQDAVSREFVSQVDRAIARILAVTK